MTGARVSSAAEQQRLAALAAYDVLDAGPDDPYLADLNNVCELAATLLGVPSAVVNLIDDRVQHQVAAFGVDPTPCRRDEAMCQTTLAEGRDVALSDAGADPRYASSPWVDGRLGRIRRYCSAILRTPDGHAVGTLCAFDEAPGTVSDAQRRALGLLARQVVDVLELRLRSRQLERSHVELSRAQDRLAAFAGQVSHDLKAPITAIVGFSELLGDLDGVGDDPSAMSYVARCSSAARRMLAMIDDLLAYARVGGTLTPTLNPLDTVLPEVIADLGPAAADADISWSGPDVLADPGQLFALLRNLLSNAVTYRGTRACIVRVLSEPVGDEMVLRVVDNGPGIPPQRRDDVLRPLVRVRKDVAGAGLGLAVCVRIAAAHGGSIRLEETPDGGTTAVVVLPV
jgi:signal transduction histidine kinase